MADKSLIRCHREREAKDQFHYSTAYVGILQRVLSPTSQNHIFFHLALLISSHAESVSDSVNLLGLWLFCCIPTTFELSGIFICGAQSFKKWHLKNSTATLISFFCWIIHRPLCQWNRFLPKQLFYENCWQRGLCITQRNQDFVSGKTCSCWVFQIKRFELHLQNSAHLIYTLWPLH